MSSTHREIVAAKNLPEAKKAICQYVAENLTEANPTLRFAYNDAGVYCRNPDGSIALLYGWTCFGSFQEVQPHLDVTRLVSDLVDVKLPILVGALEGGAL